MSATLTSYRTATRPPYERFAYWREAICETYVDLSCEGQATGFGGAIDLHQLGEARLSRVDAAAQIVRRDARCIARDREPTFLLSIQVAGRGLIEQDGRGAVLEPGDAALYASYEPYALTFAHAFGQIVVQVPREALLTRVPGADLLTGRRIRASMAGRCFLALETGLRTQGPSDPVHRASYDDVALDLVASDLQSLDGATRLPVAATWARIQRELAAVADRTDVTRETIASRLGMSVRRVNEVLATRGGSICRDLERVRLEGARADILRHGGRVRMADLAARWGFASPAAFSRAHRRVHDETPSEFAARSLLSRTGFPGGSNS